MAGIGFTLQRMTRGASLSSIGGAYVYAAVLVAGPWIFTVLGIAAVSRVACAEPCDAVQVFRSVVIYNSAFALIVTSPIAFVTTRFVSDRIYMKRYQSVTFAYLAGLGLFASVTLLLALPYYALATTLTAAETMAALHNLMLMGAAWLLVPFLGAMRGHRAVATAFAAGALLMLGAAVLGKAESSLSLLGAFNAGLCLIDAALVWRLCAEYGSRLVPDRDLLRTATRCPELVLLGLVYGCGLWADKIIMWVAGGEGVVRVAGGLQTMPAYDTPMFWAQVAAIPGIAVFFVQIETGFFRLCRAFYGQLDEHQSLREIEAGMDRIGRFVRRSVINMTIGLFAVAALAILASYVAVDPLGLDVTQLGTLRAALVGMACHTTTMFCVIFLLYFDLRRQALLVTTVFLVLNTALTLLVVPFGGALHGYGNMEASAITLVVAIFVLFRELPWLHYHAFVTNNTSLHAG